MRIILTNHARMRAMQRNITFEEIVECIANPDSSTKEKDSIICYKKLWSNAVLLVYAKDSEGNLVLLP